MIRLDVATVLLQWSVGGMFFCWFTTRHRQVGLGYGWLLRGIYATLAAGAFACGVLLGWQNGRDIAAAGTAIGCMVALVASVIRKRAGVSGGDETHDQRSARIDAMTGIERSHAPNVAIGAGPEFPPLLDLLPVVVGVIGLIAAGVGAGGNDLVAIARTLVGAAFLGAVTDSMLLGHWYLVQPGLPRKLLNEMVDALGYVWPLEVGVLLLPTGMLSVLSGSVDDGWNGTLGWMWVACALTTIVLVLVTKAALKERAYSAVMAATGLLYLAILTAFGTDLVARAVLDV